MKRNMLPVLALLLLAAFPHTLPANGYGVGDKATDFRLKNVDGSMVSLADYPGAKGFIVIFTCNHCPYSVAYEDRIIALDKKYRPKGFPVIAINPNDPKVQPEDSFEKMQERAKEKGFTFPYLLDEEQTIYPQYGATRTPHVFLLEKNGGDYLVRYIGAIDNNHSDPEDADEPYVARAVDALLAGNTPHPDMTKAIGCSIKRKK
ncbi:MAG: thioredoxin family protein [Bacteroidetes bacterium]|nr:thioredoxin family protein [Bacteroidota bacterium]